MKKLAVLVAALAVALVAPADLSSAADERKTYQSPQGPGLAASPLTASSPASAQTPMSTSALPSTAPTANAVGGTPAQLPGQTNLGGEISTLGPYTLGPDDVVSVVVRGQDEFSGGFTIGHDGTIQYGIVGDLHADGLTKDELKELIVEKVQQFVRFPDVHVTIIGFNSKSIYIMGRVGKPGKYAMRGDTIKIRDALVAAELETQYAALKKVRVIKTDPANPETRKVNLKSVLYEGKMEDNIDLVDGDVVVVPTTLWGYFIIGVKNVFSPIVSVAKWAAI